MATPPDFVAGSVLTAAQMNKIGLWTVKNETSFSGASSVTADNVFTSDFTNYRMLVRFYTSTTNDLRLKLRASGTSASTNYNYQYWVADNTTRDSLRYTSQTSFWAGYRTNGVFYAMSIIDFSGPQLTQPTLISIAHNSTNGAYTVPAAFKFDGNHSDSTSYDGVELLVATGTTTGTYTIYGYNQ